MLNEKRAERYLRRTHPEFTADNKTPVLRALRKPVSACNPQPLYRTYECGEPKPGKIIR
jgi:hypothetical protein